MFRVPNDVRVVAVVAVSLVAAVGVPAADASGSVPNASAFDAARLRPAGSSEQTKGDSAAAAATVERFHAAIVAGDSALALSVLTLDAVVLESGRIETRDEFRSQHLAADIAFAQAVKSVRGAMRVTVRGDAAWVTSTSTATGEFRGRSVDSAGAELMVLMRTPQGWRIAAIHWSSRPRRAAGG